MINDTPTWHAGSAATQVKPLPPAVLLGRADPRAPPRPAPSRSHSPVGPSPRQPQAEAEAEADAAPHVGCLPHGTLFRLQQELFAVREENAALRRRSARLEDELLLAVAEFAPPPTFLPPVFYERHRDVIDAVNDYALLYRSARLQLQRGPLNSSHNGGKDGNRFKVMENTDSQLVVDATSAFHVGPSTTLRAKEKETEASYLRERVAALTLQVEALQQRRALPATAW